MSQDDDGANAERGPALDRDIPDPVFLPSPDDPGKFWLFFPDEAEIRAHLCGRGITVNDYPAEEQLDLYQLRGSGEWLLRRSYWSDCYDEINKAVGSMPKVYEVFPSDKWQRITEEEAMGLLAHHGLLKLYLRNGIPEWLLPQVDYVLNKRNLGLPAEDRKGAARITEAAGGDGAAAAAPAGMARGTVNQRMLELLTRQPESVDWTQRQWADRLRCSPSAVAEAPAWKKIKELRAMSRVERRDRDRRRAP